MVNQATRRYGNMTRRFKKLQNLLLLRNTAAVMNERGPRCQCMVSCPNPPLDGEAFCKEHATSCPRRAPLSGAEPKYDPNRWNKHDEIRLTHNCFSYAMNVFYVKQVQACQADPDCNVPFHQPGSVSKYPKFNDTDPKTCPNLISRIRGDNPTITPSEFELKCPRGSSKIALVIDEDQDYHFLRQDKPTAKSKGIGYFSQKSGAMPVTNLDAKGHKIFDVELANHDFDQTKHNRLDYDRFCGYFCVPRNQKLYIKTGGRRTRTRAKASQLPPQ